LWQQVVITLAGAIICIAMIWAAYGFRFTPTPQPGSRLPMQRMVDAAAKNQLFIRHGGQWPIDDEVTSARPGVFVSTILFAERHKLLPQAWLYGLLFTYQSALVRDAFLLGGYSMTGWWYYFPLAMLFKTPLGTIAAMIGALVMMRFVRQRDLWLRVCLGVPFVIYALAAMSGNLNLGIRHVLPLYPLMYVAAAAVYAHVRSAKRERLELSAWFWRSHCRPSLSWRTELHRDSSMPGLAGRAAGWRCCPIRTWIGDRTCPCWRNGRREHPDTTLYLCYYGSIDPAAYGIRYLNLPGGFYLNREMHYPDRPGVMAISASRLQGCTSIRLSATITPTSGTTNGPSGSWGERSIFMQSKAPRDKMPRRCTTNHSV
jgi:hypothetical protein